MDKVHWRQYAVCGIHKSNLGKHAGSKEKSSHNLRAIVTLSVTCKGIRRQRAKKANARLDHLRQRYKNLQVETVLGRV